jgi:hypothetical protein
MHEETAGPEFEYYGEFQLEDGSVELQDLEEQGWAAKERIAATRRFSLVPKNVDGRNLRVVMVDIPEGAKPVFYSEVYRKFNRNALIQFRVYVIGWKKGSEERVLQVLPSGDIEFAAESTAAPVLLDHIWQLANEQAAPQG